MKDLYYWMAKHPDVELHFSRNDNPLYLVLEMTYKGKTSKISFSERNFMTTSLYAMDNISSVLNKLYKECGGKLFIDILPISVRARNCLMRGNLLEYEDYDGLRIGDLMKINGLGTKTIDDILVCLTEKGFTLRKFYFTRKYLSGMDLEEYKDYRLDGGSGEKRVKEDIRNRA